MNARAIARLAIGIDGAPVPDGLQRIDAVFHDLARRLAIDGDHQSNTTRGML